MHDAQHPQQSAELNSRNETKYRAEAKRSLAPFRDHHSVVFAFPCRMLRTYLPLLRRRAALATAQGRTEDEQVDGGAIATDLGREELVNELFA